MDKHPSNRASQIEPANKSTVIEIRRGLAPGPLDRAEFSVRFHAAFANTAFKPDEESIERLEEDAWSVLTAAPLIRPRPPARRPTKRTHLKWLEGIIRDIWPGGPTG